MGQLTKARVTQVLISGLAEVPLERMLAGDMGEGEWDRVVRACDELSSAPIYLGNEMPDGADPA